MTKNILFMGGSLNQTTMMSQIAEWLPEHHCFFTPFFDDGWIGEISQQGWLDFTILGGQHLQNTLAYLVEKRLPVDYGGTERSYDLVVTGTDLLLPRRIQGKRLVLVQEGMLEPEGLRYQLVRRLGMPRFLANTAATGLSDAYELFCVASQGYREQFIQKGVKPEKIAVTGIPNFDNARVYLKNDFPYRHYVLAATSSHRETLKWTNRQAFIHKARQIAAGRQLIFKLHPNENMGRARREIEQAAPGALVYEGGNVYHMIANCDVLVTETSSVTFIGLALNKEVHSDLDLDHLRRLMPNQNEGASARRIAEHCQQLLNRRPSAPQPGKAAVSHPVTGRKMLDSA